MTRRLLGLILFSASLIPAAAQDFAVTHRGDTIRGTIKIFNSGPEKKIQIVSDDKKKQNLPLLQVRSFTKDNEQFHPVKGPAGYAFMKLIEGGFLSLYGFQLENQTGYDAQFLLKRDGTSLEIPNLSFKKAMTRFLEDCAGVSEKIDNGTFTRRDVPAIVQEYNRCMEGKTTVAVSKTAAKSQPQPVVEEANSSGTESWKALEAAVTARPDFEGKADALEMIGEIRKKVSRGEKLPNFLIEGLKSALASGGVDTELKGALESINR